MGVWMGAILSYSRILAPRLSRIFILGQAAAGLGLLLDELFGVLYRARQGVTSMPLAAESLHHPRSTESDKGDVAGPPKAA
mgnify:CR=1 FL=1